MRAISLPTNLFMRVFNTVEKGAIANQLGSPVTVANSVSVDILADISKMHTELVGRYIQNVGANDLYFAIGQDCSPVSFHGMLAASANLNANGHGAGQQFDASNVSGKISVYSIGGTIVSATIIKREDLTATHGGIFS